MSAYDPKRTWKGRLPRVFLRRPQGIFLGLEPFDSSRPPGLKSSRSGASAVVV